MPRHPGNCSESKMTRPGQFAQNTVLYGDSDECKGTAHDSHTHAHTCTPHAYAQYTQTHTRARIEVKVAKMM